MERLQGKTCLVTGGASGLGFAFAQSFLCEGAHVVIADVNAEAGAEAVRHLGNAAFFQPLDVTSELQWEAAIKRTLGQFERLDVVVNNAGILATGDIEEVSLSQWRRIHTVHVEGTMLGCKYAISGMKASPSSGAIINIASISALQGYPALPAYSSAKGAILSLTRSVAIHCREKGYRIRCNCLVPGTVDTPMVHAAGVSPGAPGSAHPAELAGAALFLASEESQLLNGSTIVADNGLTSVVARPNGAIVVDASTMTSA